MSILPLLRPDASKDESELPCLGHLNQLLSCKTFRVVPPQHVIFSQGESPHTICLICNGLVKLTRTEPGGKSVIAGLRKAGWLLGIANALFPRLPYASTAETVTRSKLCFVPRDQFEHAMNTNSLFSRWVSMISSSEVYAGVLNSTEMHCLSGRQRLEKFLWELIQSQNGRDTDKAVKIRIPLKRWEVAQLLALTPEHLCRLIRQMIKEGIVVRENGGLIVCEPALLSHPVSA